MDEREHTPFSVTEYIAEINASLSSLSGSVVGEVSQMKKAASGHAYFTLKDKNTGDILECTIWRTKYAFSGIEIEVGMELLIKGKPEYYGPFGKLSFIANSIELVGEGALLKAYEKLRSKLEAEGIFAPEKKRAIPAFPHTIGVITSVHGAVIHDFNKNLQKFGFNVLIRDTRVEGPESGKDITFAVRAFRKADIDVLVLLRGGGSVQSLAGFDNELLVREIAAFPKPVIAGLGHHQDVPLAALAADAMESTPSLVAELLNESWSTAQYSLERSEGRIIRGYESHLERNIRTLTTTYIRIERGLATLFSAYTRAEHSITNGITKIGYTLSRSHEQIEQTAATLGKRYNATLTGIRSEYFVRVPARISTLYQTRMKQCSTSLDQAARLIETNNPERQLRLGYSLAVHKGKVIRTSVGLTAGDSIQVRFAEGSAETIITELT